ncbi:hypothetical protein RJT34_03786 [Clitoria ternatea]|uniref:Uncharacterized protein n=1 Tax=Clitoria ternatea TaxID=43366 RepID=A0AAN9KMR4_CLITE
MPPLMLNHTPFLLAFESPTDVKKRQRPFRFLVAWVTHPYFKEMVRDFGMMVAIGVLQSMSFNPTFQNRNVNLLILTIWLFDGETGGGLNQCLVEDSIPKGNRDCNTKFFHLSTIIHRGGNKLSSLQNDEEVVFDDKELKEMTINFYKNLYNDSNPSESCRVHGLSLPPPG